MLRRWLFRVIQIKTLELAGTMSHFWLKRLTDASVSILTFVALCILAPTTLRANTNAINDTKSSLIALGKTLFFSKALSANRDIACATCHDPAHAYSDGRIVAIGNHSQLGQRNTPSLLTTTQYARWSWDGHNQSLETQVLEPLFSTREHGLTNERQALAIVRDTSALASLYARAYGPDAIFTIDNIAAALAAYVRDITESANRKSVVTPIKFSVQVEQGRALFNGKAGCARCHDPARGFTDNRFHLGYQGAPKETEATRSAVNRLRLKTNTSKYQRNSHDAIVASLGAFVATLDPNDIGKFRTPSLLHAARTAPYMHDGSLATLREAIQIEMKVRAPHLNFSAEEIDALSAYLIADTAVTD
jgi:cytochrome c peroxidase